MPNLPTYDDDQDGGMRLQMISDKPQRKPRKPYPLVHYHGRNYTDSTVILSVRGQRYEYFLTRPQADTVEFLCQRVSARKALNFAKSHASRVLKVRT